MLFLPIVKPWLFPFQRYQLLAFGLSVTAHLALGLIFKYGADLGHQESAQLIAAPIVVTFGEPKKAISTLSDRARSRIDREVDILAPSQQSTPLRPNEKPLFPIFRPTEPYYFRGKDLTEKPLVLRDIPPDVGHFLLDVMPQSVMAHLLVNEAGDVDQVILEDSELPPHAESLLRGVFLKVKFRPGKIGSMAVKSRVKIEVTIEPVSTASPNLNRTLIR